MEKYQFMHPIIVVLLIFNCLILLDLAYVEFQNSITKYIKYKQAKKIFQTRLDPFRVVNKSKLKFMYCLFYSILFFIGSASSILIIIHINK